MNAPRYPIAPAAATDLANRFQHHAPHGDQAERYGRMRGQMQSLAEFVVMNTPACREQSLALTKLEEAMMWANAAVARNEPRTEADA